MAIRVERTEHTSWVIVDRQEAANALSYSDFIELIKVLTEECSSDRTAAVAITGAGERYFIGGVDLKETAKATTVDEAWKLMYEGLGGFCRAVYACRKPVIAAVNGYALGAGFEVLYAVDLAYATKWARFGLPPVRYGMVPPASPTLGVFLANPKLVAYLALTGEMITAEEALRYGLINDVVENTEELRRKVEEVSAKIASNEPEAVRAIRALMAESKLRLLGDEGLRTLAAFTARPIVSRRIGEFLNSKKASRG